MFSKELFLKVFCDQKIFRQNFSHETFSLCQPSVISFFCIYDLWLTWNWQKMWFELCFYKTVETLKLWRKLSRWMSHDSINIVFQAHVESILHFTLGDSQREIFHQTVHLTIVQRSWNFTEWFDNKWNYCREGKHLNKWKCTYKSKSLANQLERLIPTHVPSHFVAFVSPQSL